MNTNPAVRNLLIPSAVLLVIIIGGYFYLRNVPIPQAPGAAATSTVSGIQAGATVTETQATPRAAAPDFRTPVAYDASVTSDVRAAIAPRFAADVALLAKNSANFNAWMDLAILHKIGGDYRGAEAIWLYVTKEWPTSYIAFHNLGDLYQNFLKDPAKAKLYFDQAAKLGAR